MILSFDIVRKFTFKYKPHCYGAFRVKDFQECGRALHYQGVYLENDGIMYRKS